MESTILWFLSLSLISLGCFFTGRRVGTLRVSIGRATVFVAVAVNLLLIAIARSSAVYHWLPTELLVHLEGIVGVPLALLVLGILWHHARLSRERVLVGAAVVTAGMVFMHGAGWMIQTTPASALASDVTSGDVMQSTEYTCVPAACATVLGRLGVQTSEARMAELTQARPGTGSTIGRALHGMNQALAGTSRRATLIQPDYRDLIGSEHPVLITLQSSTLSRTTHMVVLLETHSQWVQVFDPMIGSYTMSRDAFLDAFDGKAIVVSPRQIAQR